MATEGSDMDLVVYLKGLGCEEDEQDICRTQKPLSRVMEELSQKGVEAEICDSIDLDRVEDAIRRRDRDDGQLQRFVFYRSVCRPVNLRLIKRWKTDSLRMDHFAGPWKRGLQEHLKILVSSGRHMKSWDKYRTRLKERGVDMPAKIQQAIKEYLCM